jgi:hypothetical protein
MSDWTSLMSTLNASVLATFGREVTYLAQGGGQVTVKAIFQATQRSEENSPGSYALLFIRLADLAQAPARGDEVQIDAASYKVFEIEADGEGGVTLALHRQ